MHLRSLTLTNLRNIAEARIEPGPRLNVLHGDNGAGKTSVLEGLVVLAKGRSFRSGPLSSLIGPKLDRFRLVAELAGDAERKHRIGIERARDEWQGRLDGAPMKQVTAASRLLPLVLMEPTSHALVSAGPDHRRRYLDWSVFHVKPGFLAQWRRYGRVLKQRNAALRTRDRRLVEVLDPQLVPLGVALHEERLAVFEELAPLIREALGRLSPGLGTPELLLKSGWGPDTFEEALRDSTERDLELGQTRVGPHRADIGFRVRGKAVRDRLSRGEQKILAAACLLAQGMLFAKDKHTPIFLLDDLASEFDREHLSQVVITAQELGAQQFITGTDPQPYEALGLEHARLFHVKHGVIKPA